MAVLLAGSNSRTEVFCPSDCCACTTLCMHAQHRSRLHVVYQRSLAGRVYITSDRVQQCTEILSMIAFAAPLSSSNSTTQAGNGNGLDGSKYILVITIFIICIMVQPLRRAQDDRNAFVMLKRTITLIINILSIGSTTKLQIRSSTRAASPA